MISVVLAAASLACMGAPQDAAALYKKAAPSVMTLQVEREDGAVTGTAFLVGKNGLAVTAYHVIEGAKSARVTFPDGAKFSVAGIVDVDAYHDVALLRIQGVNRPFLTYAGSHPEPGSKAYTIGAPQGLEFSISDGIIAQVRRAESAVEYQFTCPVSTGNSGGPLLDAKGRVLGVVSWQISEGQNLNFAISWAYVKAMNASQAMVALTSPKRKPIDPETVDLAKLSRSQGAELLFLMRMADIWNEAVYSEVLWRAEDSPSFRKEIRKNLLEARDQYADMQKILARCKTSDKSLNVHLPKVVKSFKNRQAAMDIGVKIIDGYAAWMSTSDRQKLIDDMFDLWHPQDVNDMVWIDFGHIATDWGLEDVLKNYPEDWELLVFRYDWFGYLVEVGIHLDVRDLPEARILYVDPSSLAEKAGLVAGDIIVASGGKPFRTWDELIGPFKQNRGGGKVAVKYRRYNDTKTTTIYDLPQ